MLLKLLPELAVPPLPGARKTVFTLLDLDIFHARACSLPPDPITNIFKIPSFIQAGIGIYALYIV